MLAQVSTTASIHRSKTLDHTWDKQKFMVIQAYVTTCKSNIVPRPILFTYFCLILTCNYAWANFQVFGVWKTHVNGFVWPTVKKSQSWTLKIALAYSILLQSFIRMFIGNGLACSAYNSRGPFPSWLMLDTVLPFLYTSLLSNIILMPSSKNLWFTATHKIFWKFTFGC